MTMTILMAIPLQTRSDDIPINETTFPDENFRNWVLAQDYGQDGVLTEDEIAGVTEIDVSEKNIASLKGVEHFTALWSLYCQNNQLTSLDLSQNTELVSLSCQNNLLTSLDLSKNTELGVLICSVNQLTSLDLSQNTAIAYLDCNNNQLTSLDISQNTALYRLECYVNQINETEMGNLVESLPANNGQLYVKWFNSSNEQNVITTSQVAAAKAKGWKVYAMNSDYDWVEYDGDTSTGIPINSTTFPDENFRNWVLSQDYGQDGVLTEAEIAGVTEIGVFGYNIADLKGIEYFTALTGLFCGGNQLTSLNVSQNAALAHLDCNYNQLTSLDVSKNTALTELQCYSNQLTSLDVSKNTALTGLYCYNNQLTSFDVSKNTALTWLVCFNNQLTSLDVSKNTALTQLGCGSNQLTSLDVSKNTALTQLGCESNQLTSLDVSKNTALTYLACSNNQINETEMGNLVESLPANNGVFYVKRLNYAGEQNVITTAQVAAAKAKGWTVLAFDSSVGDYGDYVEYDGDAAGIPINSTTFPDENFRNWVLSQDYGQDGVLTEAEIAGVTEIGVFGYNIADLKGIEYFTALTGLFCGGNQLTSLNVSQNAALAHLDCNYNQLTSLDVSKNTALTELQCYSNQLTSLDVSKNTALTGLYCYNNQLTSFDVSKNTALTWLVCFNNQLTSLDVSKNTALTQLGCGSNQLTSLDVSKNTALTQLGCESNQLTSLDVSKNTALTELGCNSNQLTSLDVSKNEALESLSCSNNQINETEMGKLVESMPANNGRFYVKRLNDVDEQNVITTAQVAEAKAKGWKVYAFDSNVGDYGQWVEYDGDEPTMEPIDTADFGSDIDEGTDLDGNVVGDILYNISSGDGSYNVAEGCIVVTTPTDDSVIDGQDIFGEDFQNNFTGIVFKVPAGKGTVKIEAQTTGTMVLKVKIGNSDPVEMELEGRLKVSFPYNVSEPTYVYIYGGSASAAPGMAGNAPATGELKLYGIEVVQGETGIESLSPTLSQGEGAWYTLDGRMLQGEPSEKGLYIHRGRKVVIK